jgi:hypothetical protein
MYDKFQIDEMFKASDERFDALERRIDDVPTWVSTGPERHHALRLETAELVLRILREKHQEAFSAAVSEALTGQPIKITRARTPKPKG